MPSTVSHRAAAPSPAPGVTRLGDPEVNFYLLEAPDGLVLVDGGLPGHLPQLQSHLEGAGRSLGDIRAVLLTHAHPDHTGVAAAARQAGADVWVHERDAAALAGGARAANRQAKPERSLLPYLQIMLGGRRADSDPPRGSIKRHASSIGEQQQPLLCGQPRPCRVLIVGHCERKLGWARIPAGREVPDSVGALVEIMVLGEVAGGTRRIGRHDLTGVGNDADHEDPRAGRCNTADVVGRVAAVGQQQVQQNHVDPVRPEPQ